MVRELLLTTIATTISIVLTFGGSAYFEQTITKCKFMMGITDEELEADHKFRKLSLDHVSNPDFTGIAEFTRSEKGTWELRGDSLCIVHEPGKKYHLDASNIKANPGKEAETKGFIKYWTDYGAEVEKTSATRKLEDEKLAVSIDKTGTRMELRATYTNEDGKEITSTLYLVKENN